MKKAVIILLSALILMSVSSCGTEVKVDDSVNVMFFTANYNTSLVPSYKDLTPGQKIEEPEAPTREGYTFLGWYKDYYKTEKWDFDNDTIGDKSIVLYADWEPAIFELTYVLNGGTMPSGEYVTTFEGGASRVLPLPTQEGFTFVSWFKYDWKDENGEITTIPGDKGHLIIPAVYEDLTLYAHWKPTVVDVKFNVNYPEDNPPALEVTRQKVNYGDIIDFEIPEDTATYKFEGWNSKRDGSGDYYSNGDIFKRKLRLTLYAVWTKK
jgi:uncharacterized repeat protein (TIGR02543 family)